MADEAVREVAFGFVLRATELIDKELEYCSVGDLVTDLLNEAERVAVWLDPPGVATQLVLRVGPVTEQM